MGVIIDEMKEEDWPAVQAIHRQGLATGQASFEEEVPDWDRWNRTHWPTCRLVARRGGKVIGWAVLRPASSKEFYLGVMEDSVYVSPRQRGGGVGKKLLRELIEISEREGIWTLQALIFPENQASLALHRSLGFRRVGRRERLGQMNGVWRDVILMERRSTVVGV
jgi:L-amino acid N-acyltransferase YncA